MYPDSADELDQDEETLVWSFTDDDGDHVSTDYDRLGRAIETTDQRGVVHEYLFDSAGRLAHDCVTDLGASGLVDDAVLRISRTYDDLGRLASVTSCDDPDPEEGAVVNQIEYVYNGWGLVAREDQEHDGEVDANTLAVEYSYDSPRISQESPAQEFEPVKYVRLSQVTYPNVSAGGQKQPGGRNEKQPF